MSIRQANIDKLTKSFQKGANEAILLLSELLGSQGQIVFDTAVVQVVALGHAEEQKIKTLFSNRCVQVKLNALDDGMAFMVCYPQDCNRLVSLLVAEGLEGEEYLQAEEDVLLEVGNVMLNSCLAEIGKVFNLDVSTNIPEVVSYQDGLVPQMIKNQNNENRLIYLNMAYFIQDKQCPGNLGIFLAENLLWG